MPGRRVIQVAALVASSLGLSAYAFGGWAAVTVDDFPETATVAQPLALSFVVRQHGVTLLSGLRPRVTATDGRSDVEGVVTPTSSGHYASKLILPTTGEWSVTVQSGFGNSNVKLPPIRAIGSGDKQPMRRSPSDRGQRLFVAKGCVTCHVHAAIEAQGYPSLGVGPDLTPKRYDAAYLRRYLNDPSIARTPGRPEMPRLGLSDNELTALVAFINEDRSIANQR